MTLLVEFEKARNLLCPTVSFLQLRFQQRSCLNNPDLFKDYLCFANLVFTYHQNLFEKSRFFDPLSKPTNLDQRKLKEVETKILNEINVFKNGVEQFLKAETTTPEKKELVSKSYQKIVVLLNLYLTRFPPENTVSVGYEFLQSTKVTETDEGLNQAKNQIASIVESIVELLNQEVLDAENRSKFINIFTEVEPEEKPDLQGITTERESFQEVMQTYQDALAKIPDKRVKIPSKFPENSTVWDQRDLINQIGGQLFDIFYDSTRLQSTISKYFLIITLFDPYFFTQAYNQVYGTPEEVDSLEKARRRERELKWKKSESLQRKKPLDQFLAEEGDEEGETKKGRQTNLFLNKLKTVETEKKFQKAFKDKLSQVGEDVPARWDSFQKQNQNSFWIETFDSDITKLGVFTTIYFCPFFMDKNNTIINPAFHSFFVQSPWFYKNIVVNLSQALGYIIHQFKNHIQLPYLGDYSSRKERILDFLSASKLSTNLSPERLYDVYNSALGMYWLDFDEVQLLYDSKVERYTYNQTSLPKQTQLYLENCLFHLQNDIDSKKFQASSAYPFCVTKVVLVKFCGCFISPTEYQRRTFEQNLTIRFQGQGQLLIESLDKNPLFSKKLAKQSFVVSLLELFFSEIHPTPKDKPIYAKLVHERVVQDLQTCLPITPIGSSQYGRLVTFGDSKFDKDRELFYFLTVKFLLESFKNLPNRRGRRSFDFWRLQTQQNFTQLQEWVDERINTNLDGKPQPWS